MKKTKKTVSPNKSNIGANKKSLKTGVKAKSETSEEEEYPVWTMPVHLSENDHEALKNFHRLHKEGKFDIALNFASNLDTVVREAIPDYVWKEIGGKLIHEKDEADNVQKDEKMQQKASQGATVADFSAFIISGNSLQPFNKATFGLAAVTQKTVEKRYQSGKEFEELIVANSKMLFGQQTMLFEDKKKKDEYFPDKFLFDFKDAEKPKFYLVETALSIQNFGHFFARITHFLSFLRNKNQQNDYLAKLCQIIGTDAEGQKELLPRVPAPGDISLFVSEMLKNKPAILLIMDNERADLPLLQETYTETWGKMVRQIVVKKYDCDKDVIFTMKPDFADIWRDKKSRKQESVTCTEEEHLEAASGISGKIYNEIKKALLETDSGLEFNPKKHYISVRKNKNLAFFQLKKKITLVVMNPEEDTRMCIKHHFIKTLPESVQKFWNGQCCTIVIENTDNLNEVIDLLKKIVKNA